MQCFGAIAHLFCTSQSCSTFFACHWYHLMVIWRSRQMSPTVHRNSYPSQLYFAVGVTCPSWGWPTDLWLGVCLFILYLTRTGFTSMFHSCKSNLESISNYTHSLLHIHQVTWLHGKLSNFPTSHGPIQIEHVPNPLKTNAPILDIAYFQKKNGQTTPALKSCVLIGIW